MAVAERRPARRHRALLPLLALGPTALAGAQAPPVPTVRVAFASAAHRAAVPAFAWLCDHVVQQPGWPAGRDRTRPFAATFDPQGVTLLGDGVDLPRGVVAAGTCSLPGLELLWACAADGTEDWFVPRDARLPEAWHALLHGLQLDVVDEPRSLDATVVIGHLAGGLCEGDPRAERLRLGAAACGEVTWTAWATPTHWRVRGRSGGGLLLPAALLWLAREGASADPAPLPLRAFAARDGDRAEAARQSVRVPGSATEQTLVALLHADDQVAFAAVDALRRLGAAHALPQIVAVARPDVPWTELAAAEALQALWPAADPATRQATRAAVWRCGSAAVRAVDLEALDGAAVSPRPAERAAEAASLRLRILVWLALLAVGLYGLWSRARLRLRPAAG
ncbi:MAG: hypothetical protein KF830_03140 [Planctomycetes bacterium]|nr:hypothetical protein [Planctomycetota bacterium]